jgi:hypothetical protein
MASSVICGVVSFAHSPTSNHVKLINGYRLKTLERSCVEKRNLEGCGRGRLNNVVPHLGIYEHRWARLLPDFTAYQSCNLLVSPETYLMSTPRKVHSISDT